MNECIAAAREVNKKILISPEYSEYRAALAELSKYPEYKEMVDVFRRKQVSHEARKINGEHFSENEELALANDYADICLITVCNNFFQAEIAFITLVKEIYKTVCDGITIDTLFK